MSAEERERRRNIIQYLIEQGADVNTTDIQGTTPLMLTAIFDPDEENYEEIGKRPLHHSPSTPPHPPPQHFSHTSMIAGENESGTELSSANDNWSANVPIMRLLIQHGANIHMADSLNETALHKAAFHGTTSPLHPKHNQRTVLFRTCLCSCTAIGEWSERERSQQTRSHRTSLRSASWQHGLSRSPTEIQGRPTSCHRAT